LAWSRPDHVLCIRECIYVAYGHSTLEIFDKFLYIYVISVFTT